MLQGLGERSVGGGQMTLQLLEKADLLGIFHGTGR